MPLDYNGNDINGFFDESADGTKLTTRSPLTTFITPNIELTDASNQIALGANNEVTLDVETTSTRTATLIDYTNDTDILQGRAGVILGGYTVGVPLAGDVTGLPSSTSVDFVGGKTDTQVSTSVDDTLAATHLNTTSTIVKRDASGDVAVSNITADNLNDNGARFSTGVLSGGLLTVNGGDNTKFDISDGEGVIVDHTTSPYTLTNVTWTGHTRLTPTYLLTNLISFVSIDINGNVLQYATKPSIPTQRDTIFLGVLVHVNQTNLDTTNDEQSYCAGPYSQIHDLMEAIGFLNISGNLFSAYSTTMEMQKSAGVMFAHGANYKNDAKNPNYIDLSGLSPATFQYRTQLGVNTVPDNTVIDPDYWDDGGTLTSLGPNKWTVQHIYVFTSNNVKIQWGQSVYNSFDAAETGVTDAFVVEPSIVTNGLFVAYLIVKSGETNLSNSTFISAGKFGNAQGSGTPTGLETLQGVYDNSTLKEMDISAGALAFTGEALSTEHIIPASDSLYNLGDDSGTPKRWANVYADNVDCSTITAQAYPSPYITVTGSLNPSNDWNYSLGSKPNQRWGDAHISSVYVGYLHPETLSFIECYASIVPDTTRALGSAAKPWGTIYIRDVILNDLEAKDGSTINSYAHLSPFTDSQHDLGDDFKRWRNVYADTVDCTSLTAKDDTTVNCYVHLSPFTDSQHDLGDNLKRWRNVYADNVDCATLTAQDGSTITFDTGTSSANFNMSSTSGSSPAASIFLDSNINRSSAIRYTNNTNAADWWWGTKYNNAANVDTVSLSYSSTGEFDNFNNFLRNHFFNINTNGDVIFSNTTTSAGANICTFKSNETNGTSAADFGTATYDQLIILGNGTLNPRNSNANLGADASPGRWNSAYINNVDCDTITAQDGTELVAEGRLRLKPVGAVQYGGDDDQMLQFQALSNWSFYHRYIGPVPIGVGNLSLECTTSFEHFYIGYQNSAGSTSNYTLEVHCASASYPSARYIKVKGDILCDAGSTFDIGTSTDAFQNIYVDNVDCATLTAQDGSTINCKDDFVPLWNDTYDLGASGFQWYVAWIREIRAVDGTNFYRANSGTGFSWLFRTDYIGTYTIHARIDNDGDMYNTNGTYGTISDERFKEDIEDARGYLSDIKRLKVKKYKLKKDPEKKSKLGFIAQDVEQVFPGLIRQGDYDEIQDAKFLKTSVLIPMLVKSVQELSTLVDSQLESKQTRIDELGAEVVSLQEENADYKNRIERLEILVDNLISPPGPPSGEPTVKKVKTS
jgi:hypothetical protein